MQKYAWVLILLIGAIAIYVWQKLSKTEDTAETDLGGGGSGGGTYDVSGGGDGPSSADLLAAGQLIGGIPSDETGAEVGFNNVYTSAEAKTLGLNTSDPLLKDSTSGMTAAQRLAVAQSQYGINTAILTPVTKANIEKGAIRDSTLRSIADYQKVKTGDMTAYEYGGGAAAFGDLDPAAINAAGVAYQKSPTVTNARALAFYSAQTGAHRGGMTSEELASWDAANLVAAKAAYAAALATPVASVTNATPQVTSKTPTPAATLQARVPAATISEQFGAVPESMGAPTTAQQTANALNAANPGSHYKVVSGKVVKG